MPNSCQANNADVNPSNLEVKQNSSTLHWLCIFMFSSFIKPALALHVRTALWLLSTSQKKKVNSILQVFLSGTHSL